MVTRTVPEGSWVEIDTKKSASILNYMHVGISMRSGVISSAQRPGLRKRVSQQFFLLMLPTLIWAAAFSIAYLSSLLNRPLAS